MTSLAFRIWSCRLFARLCFQAVDRACKSWPAPLPVIMWPVVGIGRLSSWSAAYLERKAIRKATKPLTKEDTELLASGVWVPFTYSDALVNAYLNETRKADIERRSDEDGS